MRNEKKVGVEKLYDCEGRGKEKETWREKRKGKCQGCDNKEKPEGGGIKGKRPGIREWPAGIKKSSRQLLSAKPSYQGKEFFRDRGFK